MPRPTLPAVALTMAVLALPGAPAADEITDALQSAIAAYEDGDVQYALEELEYARQLMTQLQTDALSGYLPPAPEGWTREIDTEMNAGLAMMGGGTGAEATYRREADSVSFTITLMADNPMVVGIGGMLANAAAIGAKVVRVGREKFMVQDGEMTGLVDKRILVQASGADPEVMIPVLETIDFRSLRDFGR